MKKMACDSCGGAMKKVQKGGSAEIVGMPKYGNNPRTSTGAMLKKGGSVKKYQDGGPVAAMQKAMGQKPVSTKKTMKYVRKKGSGYIPPTESNKPDTSKWAEKQASPNAKKMQDGGKITYRDAGYKTGIIKSRPTIGKGTLEKEVSYGHGYAGPSGAAITKRRYDNEGVLKKEKTRKIASEKVDKYVAKNENKIEYKKGGTAKAKFGATVAVQRSPKTGKVTGVDGGYAKVGKREPARNKFAKGGFPDLNKDGKITKADILKGRGVIKRKGGAIKKK